MPDRNTFSPPHVFIDSPLILEYGIKFRVILPRADQVIQIMVLSVFASQSGGEGQLLQDERIEAYPPLAGDLPELGVQISRNVADCVAHYMFVHT